MTSLRPAAARLLLLPIALACRTPGDSIAAQSVPQIPTADALVQQYSEAGLVRVTFPSPDPGVPSYARLGSTLNQVFGTADWVMVPFYRDPDAIPGNFDLLRLFDFPGPNGPGAFAAPLRISGFYMVEAGAPLGTFPRVAVSTGTAVPFWFVRRATFDAAAADHILTMDELRGLSPLKGTANSFQELLRPRVGEHLVVLDAKGTLSDGRAFSVHVTHVEDTTRSLRIELR